MSPAVMDVLLIVLLLTTGAVGTLVVLTRRPARQAVLLSAYGLVLGVQMLVLQAPDVAMSQIAVGTAIVPLLVVLTITKCEQDDRRVSVDDADDEDRDRGDGDSGKHDRS